MGAERLRADQPAWTPCYVALGSNLDQPIEQIRRAIHELMQITATRVVAKSSLYQSVPMGPQDQPSFINAVVALLTQLNALQLLEKLQAVEQRMGRQAPTMHWGPRMIDLDMLIHGDTHCDLPALKLPHPGLLLRNFVMAPLAEIAPHLWVSKTQTAAQVAQQLGIAGLQRIESQV
jgi:2-amino-4-hydroxy-6-hydroxymethyldihydropteridine diphosphokinase